jgi:hypothetical protein
MPAIARPSALARRGALAALAAAVVSAAPALAAADPTPPRVLGAPTAWIPPAGAITATAGSELRGAGSVAVGYGLGGLAHVEIGADTEVRTCGDCAERATPRWLPRATFRLGAPAGWRRGWPALALGVSTTFGDRTITERGAAPPAPASAALIDRPRATEAFVIASQALGPVRVHGGAAALAARFSALERGPVVRPLLGVEGRWARYPRSALLADLSWSTRLEAPAAPDARRGPRIEALAAVGARFQFFTWASIELGVRVPATEGLAGAQAVVRLRGIWEVGTPARRRLELR